MSLRPKIEEWTRRGQLNPLLRSFNQNLDTLGCLDILESLLSVLELDLASDELLDTQLSGADQVDSKSVVTGSVPEASLDGKLLCTSRHDGEVDVGLAHSTLDVGTSGPDGVDGSLDADLCATRVDNDIGAEAQVRLLDQSSGAFLCALLLRAERVRRRVALRKGKSLLVDVHRHNLAGSEALGDGHAEQTDGAGTEDDDALAGLDVGLSGDVDGDAQGLGQRAVLERDVVRQLVAKVLGQCVVFGQGAVDRGCGGKGHVDAEVVLALLAAHAAAARDAGLHCHAVADFDARHRASDLLDYA